MQIELPFSTTKVDFTSNNGLELALKVRCFAHVMSSVTLDAMQIQVGLVLMAQVLMMYKLQVVI